jgi:hypothetical protein
LFPPEVQFPLPFTSYFQHYTTNMNYFPLSGWGYRRHPRWMDNLSIPQLFGLIVVTFATIPFMMVGSILLIFYLLGNPNIILAIVIMGFLCLFIGK